MRSYAGCPSLFFFFNDTATTEIYTLSLHDALPIFLYVVTRNKRVPPADTVLTMAHLQRLGKGGDRKSTRLNSSHSQNSYGVFCLKKKKLWQQRRLRHHTDPQCSTSRN